VTIKEVRELFAYSRWANERVFSVAERLTPADLSASVASSFPSVRSTLRHIVLAEWVWLRRWRGEHPTSEPSWATEGDLADLRGQLAAVESERAQYLAALADEDLGRVVEYKTMSGQTQADPLGSLIRHVVNHSTYHRGQVATQLRQLGQSPPSTDLVLWLREAR
jgi:uncharacterized damage-inducible protein DinB